MFKTGHNYRQGQTPCRSAAQTGCKANWPVGATRSGGCPLHRLIARRIAVRKFYLAVAGCFENYPARSFVAPWMGDVHTFYLDGEGTELRYGHFRPAGSLDIGRHYGHVFNFSDGFSPFSCDITVKICYPTLEHACIFARQTYLACQCKFCHHRTSLPPPRKCSKCSDRTEEAFIQSKYLAEIIIC